MEQCWQSADWGWSKLREGGLKPVTSSGNMGPFGSTVENNKGKIRNAFYLKISTSNVKKWTFLSVIDEREYKTVNVLSFPI